MPEDNKNITPPEADVFPNAANNPEERGAEAVQTQPPLATAEEFQLYQQAKAAEQQQVAPPPPQQDERELVLPETRNRHKKHKDKPVKQGFKYVLRDMLSVIVTAVIIAVVLKWLVVDSRLVPSGSMEPTIMPNDRVIILKFSYAFDNLPERGDVIVFSTEGEFDGKEDLLKRVIGLPGDTVEIKEGLVFVNGQALEEPYIAEEPYYEYGPIEIPSGCYFMLGDNRNHSRDSHLWNDPFITKDDIIGKVVLCYWPLDRFGLIE